MPQGDDEQLLVGVPKPLHAALLRLVDAAEEFRAQSTEFYITPEGTNVGQFNVCGRTMVISLISKDFLKQQNNNIA